MQQFWFNPGIFSDFKTGFVAWGNSGKRPTGAQVLVVDVDEEFESVIGHGEDMLPQDVSAEALERITAIATDLAAEGPGRKINWCNVYSRGS